MSAFVIVIFSEKKKKPRKCFGAFLCFKAFWLDAQPWAVESWAFPSPNTTAQLYELRIVMSSKSSPCLGREAYS